MKRANKILLLLVTGIVALSALVYVLWLFVDPHNVDQKTAFIQTVSGVLGGAAVLTGLYFTWRGQIVTQQNLAQTQAATERQLENAKEQLRLTREGQITNRFTQAIDQLGKTDEDDNRVEEIRLGGIYALERIALEEPDQYHWPITQVFAAYLRRYASWQGDPSQVIDPVADIQTVLNAIGRRSRFYGAGEDEPLLLNETDFSNYSFPANAHLEGAWLAGAHFESAALVEAQLKEANLRAAYLDGAYLWGADLRDADLRGAHLEGAYLYGADLRGANLANAHFTATYLPGAKLQGVKNLDPLSLEEANGSQDTELGEVPQPKWWYVPPGDETPLIPGFYSIKVWKTLLQFRIHGNNWYSNLFLPYVLGLTPSGVFFGGSGIYFCSGPWVCDPQRPQEMYALERAPKEKGDWVTWFEKHPRLRFAREPREWENLSGSASGIEFDVEVKPDTPDNEIYPSRGREGPSVPVFPSSPRSNQFNITKGKKLRVIVLGHEHETMLILNSSTANEFDQFKKRVDEEVLATLNWSKQPEGD